MWAKRPSFNFFALFYSFLICADKDAVGNSSFYYINPHEFQSCASLSAQIKKEGKWRISKNWTQTRTVPLHFHKLSKSSNWWLAINDRMTNHLSRFLTTLFLPRVSIRGSKVFICRSWVSNGLIMITPHLARGPIKCWPLVSDP